MTRVWSVQEQVPTRMRPFWLPYRRPTLGFLPWLALFRRHFSLRLLVFLLIGTALYRGGAQAPLMDISGTRMVTAAAPPASHWRSLPTSRSSSIRWKVDATVTSRTGSARAPSRIMSPSAPTEKSPVTGLAPESEAGDRLHEEAALGPPEQLLGRADPGAKCSARGPTPGRRRVPGPHRRAGGAVPLRRPVWTLCRKRDSFPFSIRRMRPGRDALAVVAGGAEGLGVRSGRR